LLAGCTRDKYVKDWKVDVLGARIRCNDALWGCVSAVGTMCDMINFASAIHMLFCCC